MENLWAPWRMAFIEPKTPSPSGCIFCMQPIEHEDEKYHILHRGEHCFMMLNLYPYNNGHLMIAPYGHVGALDQLSAETLADMMAQAQLAMQAMRQAMRPDGFNMGMNQGKVAGAGFADHIHFHIVPRWNGDTNFMPVIADIKVMPEHLDIVYQKLLQALTEIKSQP
jgi:ATP adenylyltransferase